MNQAYTAVVKQDGGWWIGWLEEVPGVNCQESTRDELLKSLRITLSEALEMNRTDARDAAGHGYEEHNVALCVDGREAPSVGQNRPHSFTKTRFS